MSDAGLNPLPRRLFHIRRQILVGEIDPCLGMGQYLDQIHAPSL